MAYLTDYQKIMDSAPVLIWESGTDGFCSYFNQTWLQFTGKSLEEELGNGWVGGVHPEDLAGCQKIYDEALMKQAPYRVEYRLLRYDGQYRWLLDSASPKFTSAGKFDGYIGSSV